MKKIRVLIKYPWKFPDSSYYKNILNYPPKNVAFVNYKKEEKKFEVISSQHEFETMRKLKNLIRRVIRIIQIPNLSFTFRKDFDLIHCAHCISLNGKPWVVDSEVYERLSAGGAAESKIGKWIIKKRLENKSCKKIIAWSNDCRKTFEKAFPKNKKIQDKIEILPFATPKIAYKKIPHKKIRVLFVARWFEAKGGLQALEVFDRLSKKFDGVEFLFICPVPGKFKKKYSNKKIKFIELMPQKKLFNEIYPSCDIFFYPGFGDSYGFAVPEALAFGLPIVSSRTFAKSELVEDGKNGFLVDIPKDFWEFPNYTNLDEKMLNDFIIKTTKLISNNKLREKMGMNARKAAMEKFSIEKRNEKLKKIYSDAFY